MPTPFVAFLTGPEVLGEIRELILEGELVGSGILRRKPVRLLLDGLSSRFLPVLTELLAHLWGRLSLEIRHRQFVGKESPNTVP